jgi:hypothetical protein
MKMTVLTEGVRTVELIRALRLLFCFLFQMYYAALMIDPLK